MARRIIYSFVLLFFSNNIYSMRCSGFTSESENCPCSCGQSMCDLVEFVKELDKRLSIANREIGRLITLHNTFTSFQRKNAVEHKEIRNIISKLSKQQNSNEIESNNINPSSEALIAEPRDALATPSSVMADEAGKIENFTTLIQEVNDKFNEVKSLTSEVTELQQENKVLKEEMEKEKQVTRSLQDELNQTQFLIIEINERVNEKDSKNSTITEVAEIVLAKMAEYDILNKTAIENQLKKLEYTVKDVFKNETQLVQRLDSMENASAYTIVLLENGTLADRVHSIAGTVQILEKVQSQQSSAVSELEQLVDSVNDSLVRKLSEAEYAVSELNSSTSETMLSFENELSKMNDMWNNKSFEVHKIFSNIDEKIIEINSNLRKVGNITDDLEELYRITYPEVLNNISSDMQKEIEKAQVGLQELNQLSGELNAIKGILNRTTQTDELDELWNNITEQNKVLQEQSLAFFSDMSEIMNNTNEKIMAVENQFLVEKAQMENFSVEFQILKLNQSSILSLLESRVESLSTKVEEIDQQNLSLTLFARDLDRLRDLQLESVNTMFRRLELMQESLMRQIHSDKEEVVGLINKLESSVNSTRQGEIPPDDEDESSSSRLRIDAGKIPIETTTEDPVPCMHVPTTTDDELVTAYFRQDAYKEVSAETLIPHGEQLLFSCRKIGRFLLSGSRTRTCINGQWSHGLPRCEKLLDESTIRDAIQVEADPCLEARGQFPDPSDCTKYFNCWDGQKTNQKCPQGLHFNANSSRCDFPSSANCIVQHPEAKLRILTDIIPPIAFAPAGVDVVNSLLATSAIGELVVYPGTTVDLLCLYPRELGEPQWDIEGTASNSHFAAWDTSGVDSIKDVYKLKLTIAAASEGDTGLYTCVSPSQKRHTIRVLVKAVKCADFVVDAASPLSISYMPSDVEGRQKIMTTQVSFHCPCGYSLNGSNTATCKASGTWSQDLPTCQEEETVGCVKPDLHNRPELSIDPDKCTYSIGEMVYFKCKNQSDLLGAATARCSEKREWAVAHGFPSCG